jgi:hypothetical protein
MELRTPIDQLKAQLFALRETHPHSHLYVLLDQNHPVAATDELHFELLKTRVLAPRLFLVKRPDLAHDETVCPLLLQLYQAGENGYPDPALLDLTLQCAVARCASVNGSYVAGWFFSETQPQALARSLAENGVLFDLGRGKQRFVPFFEPMRLALLADTAGSRTFLHQWMGKISHWLYINAAGGLCMVERSSLPSDYQDYPPILRKEHFAAQERISHMHFVLMALVRAQMRVPAPQPELQLNQAIEQAQLLGLSHTEDLIFYALNQFSLGAGWAQHPQAKHLIAAAAQSPDTRLAASMQDLPDEVLDEIAAHGLGSRR